MTSDKFDINGLSEIVDINDEAVIVPLDIENDTAFPNDAGVRVSLFDLIGRLPNRLFRFLEPRSQRSLRIRMTFPEFA